MTKAAEMARVSVKGGFNLMWGLAASTIIAALGSIIAANLLGEAGYGLYTIALAAPNLISTFGDWGMTSAMVKYTAQCNAQDRAFEVRSIFAAGILFETVLGFVLAGVGFLASGVLADLYSLPNIMPLIQVASLTILTSALLSTGQAAFVGMERMELNSISLIVQAIIRTTAIPALVIIGLGPLGAVLGFAVASFIAGLVAVFLMGWLFKGLPKPASNGLEIRKSVRTMFSYGFPLSIATIVTTFQTQFYVFLLPLFVAPDLIGNYGVATTFVVLITFFSSPVSTVLFPAFSKLDPERDRKTLKNVFQFSVKYASLLVVPATTIVMALARPGISLLFPEFSEAPLFLALFAVNYLYVVLGNLSVGGLINGQGQTKFNLKLSLITLCVGTPLSVVLISRFGVFGYIVTALVDGVPSLIIALRWLKKRYDVAVDWMSSAKILLSGVVAAAVTYGLISFLTLSDLIELFIGIIVFVFSFLTVIALTRAINRNDIETIRETMTLLGPLQRLTNFVLNIIERLL